MGKSLTIKCAAKINLSLDVTGRREDGYHTLESIFQSVGVYDTLKITVQEGEGISLSCNVPYIPRDERNLAYRAAKAFLEASGKQCRVEMYLKKRIPSGAGMGGGSADAAGVLYGLNLLLDCGYTNKKLREIGVKLGADVPFMLMGGTALATGVGEILKPLRSMGGIPLAILKGRKSISTPAAYAAIDGLEHPQHPDTPRMLEAIRTHNIPLLAETCANLFEAAAADCRDVERAKQALLAQGAKCAVMTGSGSAVFGIFDKKSTAKVCVREIGGDFAFAEAVCTVKEPFIILEDEHHEKK